uniref:Uncharacterized protein n=1 Tax=Podoviridae sp. cttxo15 TaxID=2826584 RepID=A0A8S5N2K2_9CAUD|nr:MAG TPA: hypothetical protein [Podoviridae sp. cttxo15]
MLKIKRKLCKKNNLYSKKKEKRDKLCLSFPRIRIMSTNFYDF